MSLHQANLRDGGFVRLTHDDPYRAAREIAKQYRAATRANDTAEIARLDDLSALTGLHVLMGWDRREPHMRTAMLDPYRSRCADAQTTIFTRRADAEHPSSVGVPPSFTTVERWWSDPEYRAEVAEDTQRHRDVANAAIDAGMADLVAKQEARWAAEEHAKAMRSAVQL